MTALTNLEEVRPLVDNIESEHTEIVDEVKALSIETKEEADELTSIALEIKAKHKEVTALKNGFLKPIKELTKRTNDFFNPALKSLERSERAIKDCIKRFLEQQENARRASLVEASRQFQEGNKSEGRAALARADEHTIGKIEGVQIRSGWKIEVTDKKQLVGYLLENDLLDWIKIDETAIKKFVKSNDDAAIPGVVVEFDPTLALKS